MEWDVIVIGGGASGLMAAGRAGELGKRVLLLEKMGRVGLKLSLTGKGRCNLTNSGDLQTFIKHYRHNGKFLYNAFAKFFNDDLISFFESRGLPLVEERGGRIFPASNRAQEVVRVLREYALSHRTRIQIHSPVEEILVSQGKIRGVICGTGEILAAQVILATGGASYPQTGSTGDGYRMAEKLGHTIRPIKPALVPLETEEAFVKELQGLSLKNVKVTLFSAARKVEEEFGEMLFTHFGVSGPIILSLSGRAVEEMAKGQVELAIDFKPALSWEEVEARLIREIQTHHRKEIGHILTLLLPQRLVPIFLQRSGLSPHLKAHDLRVAERKKIVALLKDWRLTIKKSRPIAEAIVTAGGVEVKEINPFTMESKLVPGLYFCGEVIDVDGQTGGYNLQAAFSTGWVAGEAAGKA
ncbi:MAG: NAD(P)/FAD-dependent oxidoreductase [Thermodesulfobacteriota bacterium]